MSKKTRKFKTEVQQLLDLVIHSLYSKKEIFLRELISNASDAIDRLRFEGLTDKSLLEGDENWKIKIAVDADARTLTISDNGIGMTSEELDRNLGTIANSGTRNFLEALKEGKTAADLEMIGQFGVGFYASFMVADSVTVVTRHAGSGAQAMRWMSKGDGSYSVQEVEREQRGTDVTLHLREDMADLLSEWRIREVVKQYSDYIAYPVTMDVEREEKGEEGEEPTKTITEETLNSMKAIWKKAKADVTEEEYKEFYHHVSHDFGEPLRVVHYAAEGATEFKALMFIPEKAPFDMYFREHQKGIQLYVRNVFITDECKELLPDYLRFVCGVVDSSDLPLNVSREMLQDAAVIRRISKSLVSKLLSELKDMQEKDAEAYRTFYAQFGRVFKEGVHQDFENHDKLKELVLFRSTKSEEVPLSLHDYVERMPSSQKEIYFITADSQAAAASSPHLEAFKARDYEVLFMVDPIDEWVVQRLTEYDGKKLKAVDRGDVELDDDET
ncbi:MAG: molecular chaperone HtpG, partial [Kiritimatiellae bacterium]|nr:molecular chaperone HtpG [Kiritimatiellia bacterium]